MGTAHKRVASLWVPVPVAVLCCHHLPAQPYTLIYTSYGHLNYAHLTCCISLLLPNVPQVFSLPSQTGRGT
jgi:hypothetical protein